MVMCIAYFGFGLTTPDLERVVIECPVSLDTLAGKDCELTNTCSFYCSVGSKVWLGDKGMVDRQVILGEVWVGAKGVVDGVVISREVVICGEMVVSA